LFRKKLRRAPVEVEVNTALNLRIGVFEQVFAKLKHLLPEAAARTVEAVWDAIGQLIPSLHTNGMRQLLRKRGACLNLNSSRPNIF
jgi:hypothetical protein